MFSGTVLYHTGLYHVNICVSYGCIRFGAICHLTRCTFLKNIEINKVYLQDSHMGYVLEPKEVLLLKRIFPRALGAKEQCNLEDRTIIGSAMVVGKKLI